VGWDRHKLLCDGTDKYVPWIILQKTIARHQNVAQYISSKKPLSTKTADRHTHARSYHLARKISWSVPASRAWRSAHMWEKQICLKIQQRQRNAKWFQSLLLPPSGSFNSKNFQGFFNISGWLVVAWWSPTAKNIVSGTLVQPQRPAQNPDH